MKSFWLSCATLGPIGYLPAPGTCATLATLPLIYMLAQLELSMQTYGWVIAVALGFGYIIVTKALSALDRQDDPSEIVMDEVLGTLVVFWGLPFTIPSIILAVVLFRFFDITKTLGIGYFELFCGAWGIILDDLAAAVLTNVMVHLILMLLVN